MGSVSKAFYKNKNFCGFCLNRKIAPFDVIFNENNDMDSSRNVVQPDISVICDKNKLNNNGCLGAPDLIIEVVSPYNPTNDYIRKLSLYSQFKVREYWIVNPMKESILVYQLGDDNAYAAPETYTFKDKLKVGIFENLFIDFNVISL